MDHRPSHLSKPKIDKKDFIEKVIPAGQVLGEFIERLNLSKLND